MVTEFDIVVRLVVAVVLGGMVGIERDLSRRPLGIRTASIVTMSAALFPILVADIAAEEMTRIVQGLITGVGFLGAGVIFKAVDGSRVQGLTTAATLWMLVGIGYAAGTGMFFAATVATFLLLAILLTKRRWRLLE